MDAILVFKCVKSVNSPYDCPTFFDDIYCKQDELFPPKVYDK